MNTALHFNYRAKPIDSASLTPAPANVNRERSDRRNFLLHRGDQCTIIVESSLEFFVEENRRRAGPDWRLMCAILPLSSKN